MQMRVHDIVRVEPLQEHTLRLWFDDGLEGELDLSGYLRFEGVFEALRDPERAREVHLGPTTLALTWPNGADIDSEAVYRHLASRGALRVSEEQVPRPRRHAPAADPSLPEVSRFFGIVIVMYFDDHLPPHLHAMYGEHEARLGLEDFEWIGGALPTRAKRMVREWAELHRAELLENWARARRFEPLQPIAPLE